MKRATDIGYFYVVAEEDSTKHAGYVKFGNSLDPLKRVAGYQAGNPRRLYVVFTLIGGQPLEEIFKHKFAADKVGTGGDEWFRVTPEFLDFVRETLQEQLTVSHRFVHEIGGPISIPTVKLGEANQRKAIPISPASTVRHGVAEAHPPINPYAKACGEKR
jgi:hypothetical protein